MAENKGVGEESGRCGYGKDVLISFFELLVWFEWGSLGGYAWLHIVVWAQLCEYTHGYGVSVAVVV